MSDCAVCKFKEVWYLRDKAPEVEFNGLLRVHPLCKRDAETAVSYWNDGSAHFTDGAWRWKSNGSIPFTEMTGLWVAFGFIPEAEHVASQVLRDVETEAFLAAYRANPPKLTAEARAEARAAHGPGVKLVNVVTGQEWTT